MDNSWAYCNSKVSLSLAFYMRIFFDKLIDLSLRLLLFSYSDKVHGVRRSVDGYPLPLVRQLRYTALPDKNVEEKSVNTWFSNYGQFITHDLVYTPFYQAQNGLFLDCCAGYYGGEKQVHPKCYAITIAGDPFYSHRTRETCLNFARAILAPNYGCSAGYANPVSCN